MKRPLPSPRTPLASHRLSEAPAQRPASPRPLVPAPGRHEVRLARLNLRRVPAAQARTAAEPAPSGVGQLGIPTGMRASTPVGVAEPCDLSLWSRGLYGVFLPERRQSSRSIEFSDRRC